jgi:hypothetical protein
MTALANAAALLLVLVPGVGATMALYGPGRLGAVTRLALSFALGYGVVALIALVLTLTRLLGPVTFLVGLGVATVALWVTGLRRHGLRAHAAAVRDEVRDDPWSLGVGLAVVVGAAVVAWGFSPLLNLSPSAAWRYVADAKEIADAGRIPAFSLQYGGLYPPTVSKVLLNTFNAGLSYVIGAPLALLGAITWLGAVGVVAALWSLGREIGLRYTAPLLPLLTVLNRVSLYKEMSVDLHQYKAETFGRMVAFTAVAVGVRAIRVRGPAWKDAIVAGVLLALAAATHLVTLPVAGALLAWYWVARAILDRDLPRLLKTGAVIAGVTVAVTAAFLILPRGDIGFQGVTGGASYAGFGSSFDPTLYLYNGRVADTRPGTWFLEPGRLVRAYVVRATRASPTSVVTDALQWVLPIVGLGVAILMLLRFPADIRPIGLTAWGLGVTLVLGALYFSFRYDLYVFGWFGVRRLYDYASFPIVLMGLALVEAAVGPVARRLRVAPAIAGAVAVIIGAAILLPTARVPGGNAPATTARAEPLQWIRDHAACDARILTNQRTTGVFQVLTGRVHVVEGMAPYLRPTELRDLVALLRSSREFLADPVAHQDLLDSEGVDYVMILKVPLGTNLGAADVPGGVDEAALASLPGVELVHSSAQADIYRVDRPSVGTFPSPVGFPGYRCRRGPIR